MRYVLAEFDGTARARRAVYWAASLAKDQHARLHIVWVIRQPVRWLDVPLDDSFAEEGFHHALSELTLLRQELGLSLGRVHIAVRFGEPAREVARYASELGVREVVLSANRRLPDFLTGVARVRRHLKGCNVTVVK